MLGFKKKNGKNGKNGKEGKGTVSNVRVGKAQVAQDAAAHTRGVKRGNARGNSSKEDGIYATDDGAHASARRSTGINPDSRDPIDPRMPNLPPS